MQLSKLCPLLQENLRQLLCKTLSRRCCRASARGYQAACVFRSRCRVNLTVGMYANVVQNSSYEHKPGGPFAGLQVRCTAAA